MKAADRVRLAIGLAAALLALPAAAQQRVATTAMAPATLIATTTSTTTVDLRWSTVPGAGLYDVFRRVDNAPFSLRLTTASTSYTDAVLANKTYYYFVRARNASESADSNIDIATTVAFSDDPIVAGQTPIRASIIMQLRTAVNCARASAGLQPASWTDPVLGVSLQHIAELRTALNQALSAAGMAQTSFTDPTLVADSTPIKKVHVKELRQGVKGVQPGGVLTISGLSVSEPYFSPNGNAVKETTTLSGTISSADASWTVNVHAPGGTSVRSATGSGALLNFTWDGRNGTGVVQPDGVYTMKVAVFDGVYATAGIATAVLDVTAPAAALTTPGTGYTISNVRQNGSTSMTATGTATDANLLDWDVAAGTSSMAIFAQGTSAVSNATLGTWTTDAAANGTYSVRLQVRDRAGNSSSTTSTGVAVAHFAASQNVHQADTAAGGTVTYASIVPFPVTEVLTIRNSAGTTVRTLVNGSRGAGTYQDAWNGRNDAAALLPDGAYSYVVTVTEGANVLTWDQSAQMRPPNGAPVLYPSCSSRTMTLGTCASHAAAGRTFDPYTNDPLKIHYSVNEPSRVMVVFTDLAETPGNCGANETCVINGAFRAAGNYVEPWAGVSTGGVYQPARSKLTVVRRTDMFPKNYVVLYGSGAPVEIANLELTPAVFSAEGGSMTIEFDLAVFGNVPAAVTLQMVRQPSGFDALSTLRTVTLPAAGPGPVTYTWNGKADSNHWVAPGEYALVVTATANGASSSAATRFAVVY